MVTINVPRNKLNPIFRCGFLTSPAIKVTLFHASELKILPTIADAIAPKAATPIKGVHELEVLEGSIREACCFIVQASVQLASQIAPFAAKKPKMIKPKSASSFAVVKVV